jgi:predicted type IV restriction endonuclease
MLRNKILFITILFLACCGYTTRAIIPSNIKTIAIPVVGNETIKPGLGELLTEQLTNDFTQDRSLKITNLDKANLVLECKIVNYEKSPQSYTSEQEVSVWKVTLGAEVSANNKTKPDAEALTAGNVSAWITYNAEKTEDEGINLAIEKLSQEILRKVLTAW